MIPVSQEMLCHRHTTCAAVGTASVIWPHPATVALWSFSGSGSDSGNTWVRLLLEAATERRTTSASQGDENEALLFCNLTQPQRCSEVAIESRDVSNNVRTLYAGCGALERRVVLVRGPFDAIWSEYQRMTRSDKSTDSQVVSFDAMDHRSEASLLQIAHGWHTGVAAKLSWARAQPNEALVVRFEDLQGPDGIATLQQIAEFSGHKISFERAQCAFKSSSLGIAHRNRTLSASEVTYSVRAANVGFNDKIWNIVGESASQLDYGQLKSAGRRLAPAGDVASLKAATPLKNATLPELPMPLKAALAATTISRSQLECALHESRSTGREDLLLLPLLVGVDAISRAGSGVDENSHSRSRFIELGAYNGIDGSQTLMLERCFGWGGVLIEANPSNYADLCTSNRTVAMTNAAVCANETGSTVPISRMGGTVAGDVSSMGQHHKVQWASVRGNGIVQVPCYPLFTLARGHAQLVASGAIAGCSSPPVSLHRHSHAEKKRLQYQYMSLDVEGAELRVLQSASIDLASRAIDVLLVECQYNNAAARGVVNLLTGSGYKAVQSFPKSSAGGANCLYVSPPLDQLAQKLSPWPRRPFSLESLVKQFERVGVHVYNASGSEPPMRPPDGGRGTGTALRHTR